MYRFVLILCTGFSLLPVGCQSLSHSHDTVEMPLPSAETAALPPADPAEPPRAETAALPPAKPAEVPLAEPARLTLGNPAEPSRESLTTRLAQLPKKTATTLAQLPMKTAVTLIQLPKKAVDAVLPTDEHKRAQYQEAINFTVEATAVTVAAPAFVALWLLGHGCGP
jgi:hypothetical protein